MATVYDIATQLNVSPGLVSGVLNGKTVRARDETRQRIINLASELNYRPSAVAKALSSGRIMQIGALTSAPLAGAMESRTDLRGLIEAAARHDYRVVVLPLREGAEGCRQLENLILDKVCDGISLFSNQMSGPHLNVLAKHSIPCVVMGDPGESDWSNHLRIARVDFDNYRYAWDSVAWLVSQGHRRIAYARDKGEVEHAMAAASATDATANIPQQHHTYELQRGFRDAMRELCGDENPPLVHCHTAEDAVNFARSGVATAVISRYLHGALFWTMRLNAAGLRLPDDFTILAHLEADELSPLSLAGCLEFMAIHTRSHRELGAEAGAMLLNWIQNKSPAQPVTLVATNVPRWGMRTYTPAGEKPSVQTPDPPSDA